MHEMLIDPLSTVYTIIIPRMVGGIAQVALPVPQTLNTFIVMLNTLLNTSELHQNTDIYNPMLE